MAQINFLVPSWNRWNSEHLKRRTPNAERQKFWTDRSVVWILIFLEKFEKISSADFIAKNLKKISSVEFIDADCIEKKFALLISLKKISTVDFIEKNFSNPKPQNDRPVVFKRWTPNAERQTPMADFHGPTGRTFLRFLLGLGVWRVWVVEL